MQDRLRFRIFEKPTKTMKELNACGYSDFDPFCKGISHLIMIPAGLDNTYVYNKTCLYNPKNYSEPMQCTGLKDKNGKLIFEGDIVQWGITNFIIVWRKCQFALKKDINQKSIDYSLIAFDGNELEIIGNVYQNEELLGGANANI